MITQRERERERLSSPDHDNVSQLPVFGPENPYEPLTWDGEDAIERWESPQAATTVDRWLDVNRSLWHRSDPRMMTTELFNETATCEIHKDVIEVRTLRSSNA